MFVVFSNRVGFRMYGSVTLLKALLRTDQRQESKQLTTDTKKMELSRHTHGTARPRPVHPSYIHRLLQKVMM